MSDTTLVLDNVHVSYGSKHQRNHVLKGFSLHINAGRSAVFSVLPAAEKALHYVLLQGLNVQSREPSMLVAAVLQERAFIFRRNNAMWEWYFRITRCSPI